VGRRREVGACTGVAIGLLERGDEKLSEWSDVILVTTKT
jgi:hypothetical protein